MVPQSRNSADAGPTPFAAEIAAFDDLGPLPWSAALMLASLIEPRSVDSLAHDLLRAGVGDASGGPVTPLSLHNAINKLRACDLIEVDGPNYYLQTTLGNYLIGHSAMSLDAARKATRSAQSATRSKRKKPHQQRLNSRKTKAKPAAKPTGTSDDSTYLDRQQRFDAIGHYVIEQSGFHPFGFHGSDERIHRQREWRSLYWLGEFEELAEAIDQSPHAFSQTDLAFIEEPFDAARFHRVDRNSRTRILDYRLKSCLVRLESPTALLDYAQTEAWPDGMWRLISEVHLLRGNSKFVEETIADLEKNAAANTKVMRDDPQARNTALITASELRGSLHFARGEYAAAVQAFENVIKIRRGDSRKKKFSPHGLSAIFFIFALIRRGDADSLRSAVQSSRWAKELAVFGIPSYLDLVDLLVRSLAGESDGIADQVAHNREHFYKLLSPGLGTLLFAILSRQHDESAQTAANCLAAMRELIRAATANGYHWIAWEAREFAAQLAAEQDKPLPEPAEPTPNRQLDFTPQAFSTAIRPVERWEKSLVGLEKIALAVAPGAATKTVAHKQIVWIIDHWDADQCDQDENNWHLQPCERTITSSGRIGKMRKVTLRRLRDQPEKFPTATAQDHAAVAYATTTRNWSYNATLVIDDPRALLTLVGHPLIFYADSEPSDPVQTVELVKAAPRLDVTEVGDGSVEVRLLPDIRFGEHAAVLVAESTSRLLIYEASEIHRQLESLLAPGPGANCLRIPAAARERLLNTLSQLSTRIDIGADRAIADSSTGNAEVIAGDSTLLLRLLPGGRGLDARLLVRPVAGSSIEHPPGEGKAVLFAAVDSTRYQATRDLGAETAAAETLIGDSPTLRRYRGEHSDPWQWRLENPVDCLQLLSELQRLDPAVVRVEWPEGQPFRIVGHADSKQLKLSLSTSGKSDWLEASGELEIDADRVLQIRQLLDLLDADRNQPDSSNPLRHGFVKIGDNEFLALSESLQAQLNDLYSAASIGGSGKKSADEKIQIHPLAAFAIQDLSRDATVIGKKPKAWTDQFKRLKAARDHHPDPPKALRAELRSYQLDGYRWLSRLALLGAGACLADDMGLGKTVQALALLIERAKLGPSLVIAPTSVAANWINEAQRFAPTLRPLRFGDGDRAAMLDQLRPGDLVVLSYGLLHSEIEKLSSIEWNTVVVDEAQAIKNRDTQRSKAVMQLKAGYRIITTGTPVENRLAELHNLFQFINPGLLGSWQRFRQVFADPIEQDDDQHARNRLRRLIRPFLLRRLKSEVLRDLPPRTDIELSVEPSDEETAFYEALRRKAIEEIESGRADDGPGAIRILAELTRLRRACCHPRLIDPDSEIASSKLQVFADTLEEILAGGHKVLVFSQFVDHLAFVRDHLENETISYQYLDGSTPTKKRQQAVDAFQSGEGDVFLISLKAGGFGLNLTAADYVIHLDPWWNPAAEDQASDRAHRIGQQRPVTVYRLIVRNTIEEKIVSLHHRKRELAESLLEGTGHAARLTPDDMLELLRS